MNRSSSALCALLLFVGSAAGSSPAVTASSPALVAPSFDAEFRRLLTQVGVPGGAYAIVRDGRIEQTGAHGVRAVGAAEAIDAHTVFRIASVSKTFAAQLTAMVVTEGKLSWDDDVTRFVPGFQLKRPGQAERLQLQYLLGQATGIVPNAYDNLLEADVPLSRILPQFAQLEPICPTGRCYTYQNILFSLVEPALEQATQRPYANLLQERLLQPLGMRNASVGMDAFLAAGNRAMPHQRRNRRDPSDRNWIAAEVAAGYYQVAPAAGVNASVTDLGLWLLAQMGARPDIVHPEQVAELTRKRLATPRELRRRDWRDLLTDAHYGLGWRIYAVGSDEIVMHSGWVKGFVADIGYSPERSVGLVVLLNGETPAINAISTRFWADELAQAPVTTAKTLSLDGVQEPRKPAN